jgi:formylglycine-generating enzyme required for sulfatase activity
MASNADSPSPVELMGMEFVAVGNPGNVAAPKNSSGLRLGRVDYDYLIGKHEVTYGQWVEFLNAKAKSDPTGLYDPSMTYDKIANGIQRNGTAGNYTYSLLDDTSENLPVTFINFTDAVRFANWMNNGKGDSSTEHGAYTITTANLENAVRQGDVTTYIAKGKPGFNAGDQVAISGFKGIGFDVRSQIDNAFFKKGRTFFTIKNDYPNANAQGKGQVVAIPATRSEDATFWIPSEDEWFKAAYYSPDLNNGAGGYYTWATQSNEYPGNSVGPMANQANIPSADYSTLANTPLNPNLSPLNGPNLLTPVGAFTNSSSYYGTFDQDGNITEWTETIYDETAAFGNWNRSPNSTRSKHGATYYSGTPGSSRRDDGLMPNDMGYGSGFRLAAAAAVRNSSTSQSNKTNSTDGSLQQPDSVSAKHSDDSSHDHSSHDQRLAGPAFFGGPIDASQEIWPTVYPASGYALLVLDAQQTELRYEFRIKGLDFGTIAGIGPVTERTGDDVNGMHIHFAPPGAVGDPVLGIINPNQDKDTEYHYDENTEYWTITGRWTAEDPSVVSFEENLKNYLFQGLDYINIHAEDVVLGVIRGQFNPLNDVAKAGSAALINDGSSAPHDGLHLALSSSLSCCDHADSATNHQSHGASDILTGKNTQDLLCCDNLSNRSDHGQGDSIVNFDAKKSLTDPQHSNAVLNRTGAQAFTPHWHGFMQGLIDLPRDSNDLTMVHSEELASQHVSILAEASPLLASTFPFLTM